MPSFNSIHRPYPNTGPRNTDEEDVVSGAADIHIDGGISMPPKSILSGESFGHTKFTDSGHVQSSEVKGSFPTMTGPFKSDAELGNGSRRSSSFKERNEWASPYEGMFHSTKRYGSKK